MKLSNKKIFIIVLFMIVALSGLVVLQTILLNTALKAEEDTFRRNVILALNNVVNDLISFEARSAILQISIDDSTFNGGKRIIKRTVNLEEDIKDTLYYFHGTSNRTKDVHDSLFQSFEDSIEKCYDQDNKIILDSNINKYQIAMIIDDTLISSTTHKGVNFIQDSLIFGSSLDSKDSARIMVIEAALNQMNLMEQIPIEKRIDTHTLDSAISESFNMININLDYSFAVTNRMIDSMLLEVRNPNLEVLSKSPYKTILFPDDFLIASNYLILDFPNKQFFIYSKLLSLILPTLFLLVIIISIFIYSIKLLLRQRKTSIRLTDFINNMTHEFKTPISTIQLASEAIAKDEVLSDKEKMRTYNKMILSENRRMKNHVDKILQIATLEEGDYILSHESLDMHKLIDDVVESFSILLKQHNGIINLNLKAERIEIDGDRVHILNIMYNLLDNALKYSVDNPQITISTINKDSHIEISVRDNGMGIHPDDVKFVFDKYYRVGSGDVHDIKGFGLGLSYVKMMVEAHDGSVRLLSALNKGTEVIITLPLK